MKSGRERQYPRIAAPFDGTRKSLELRPSTAGRYCRKRASQTFPFASPPALGFCISRRTLRERSQERSGDWNPSARLEPVPTDRFLVRRLRTLRYVVLRKADHVRIRGARRIESVPESLGVPSVAPFKRQVALTYSEKYIKLKCFFKHRIINGFPPIRKAPRNKDGAPRHAPFG